MRALKQVQEARARGGGSQSTPSICSSTTISPASLSSGGGSSSLSTSSSGRVDDVISKIKQLRLSSGKLATEKLEVKGQQSVCPKDPPTNRALLPAFVALSWEIAVFLVNKLVHI